MVTCRVEGWSIVCFRGGGRCDGTGRQPVVQTAPGLGKRWACPVCDRSGLPTYTTEDGREILLGH